MIKLPLLSSLILLLLLNFEGSSEASAPNGPALSLTLVPSEKHKLQPPFDSSGSAQLGNIVSIGDVVYLGQAVQLGKSNNPNNNNNNNNKASLWFSNPCPYTDWQAALKIQLPSSAGGLALWYIRQPGIAGPMFGGPDRWHGLAVSLDVTPGKSDVIVAGVLNAGDFSYSPVDENRQFGKCARPKGASQRSINIRLTYVTRTLKVDLDDKGTGEWQPCFERSNTDLAPGNFFGISADSSNDIESFQVQGFQLYEIKRSSPVAAVPPAISPLPNNGNNSPIVVAESELLKTFVSAFNTLMGPFRPGDRNIQRRMSDLETNVQTLIDSVRVLTEACGKLLARQAAVDPNALLTSLQDIRNTINNVQELGHHQQQLKIREMKETPKSWIKWYLAFLCGQCLIFVGYNVIMKRREATKKYI